MSTIKQKHIRNFTARYHRNGVSGTGFYACEFLWLDGRQLRPMRAVLVPDSPGACYVTSEALADRWRGDDFEPLLREALRLFEQAQPEKVFG